MADQLVTQGQKVEGISLDSAFRSISFDEIQQSCLNSAKIPRPKGLSRWGKTAQASGHSLMSLQYLLSVASSSSILIFLTASFEDRFFLLIVTISLHISTKEKNTAKNE